ncbi:MAG: transposase [Desulfamplus sp.]|nr:transposase [Desulfamplus sp.]
MNMLLGQLKTKEKSNKITAIPELLDLLDISQCIVTIFTLPDIPNQLDFFNQYNIRVCLLVIGY